jgi:hypothetical protein
MKDVMKEFGTFRISAEGRVFVRDLALLQAIRDELHQEAVMEKVMTEKVLVEKVPMDVVHVGGMPPQPIYSTLA